LSQKYEDLQQCTPQKLKVLYFDTYDEVLSGYQPAEPPYLADSPKEHHKHQDLLPRKASNRIKSYILYFGF